MKILHKDDGKCGSFYIEMNGITVGEMTYEWSEDNCIYIVHTEVGPELSGQGAGKKLLFEAVAFARKKGIKINPVCPFVVSVFERVPEINDVL
jgi:predicted GNAT family acetyltransferase